jgi:hypothetical protein
MRIASHPIKVYKPAGAGRSCLYSPLPLKVKPLGAKFRANMCRYRGKLVGPEKLYKKLLHKGFVIPPIGCAQIFRKILSAFRHGALPFYLFFCLFTPYSSFFRILGAIILCVGVADWSQRDNFYAAATKVREP